MFFLSDRCCTLLWQSGCLLTSRSVMNVAFHCGNCPAFLSRASTASDSTRTMLLERQKEYKMAALRAKKQGDLEQARLHFKTSKVRAVCFKTPVSGAEISVSAVLFCINLNFLNVRLFSLLCCVSISLSVSDNVLTRCRETRQQQ